MSDTEVARRIIDENKYLVLATASCTGEPWVSPVFFACDANYNIYWASNKDSLHSKLLKENPRVAITIFNSQLPEGEGDAVYIKAIATELSEPQEVEQGIKIFNDRATKNEFKIKDVTSVVGNGIWRIYRATPQEVTKLIEGEFINGQYTDRRSAPIFL